MFQIPIRRRTARAVHALRPALRRIAVRAAPARRAAPAVRAALALAATLTACASYTPAPLVPADELELLRATTLETLRLQPPTDAAAVPGAPSRQPPAFDPSDGLDEAELVAVALSGNPGLRAQRLQLGEADALLVSAGLWPDPVLGFSVRPGIDGADSTGYEADLLFELLSPDERPARAALAGAQGELARADVLAAELRLVADVRRARLAVLAADRLLALARQEAGLADEALELVRRQRGLGEASDLDVALVVLEQAVSARRLRGEQAAAEGAERELAALAGLPPDTVLPLAGRGAVLDVPLRDDPDDAALDAWLIAGNPELRARAAEHEAAEQELRLAVARAMPRLALGPSFEREVEGTKSLGLGVELSLPLWDANRGDIAERTAARETARAAYVAALHAVRARAFAARAELRRARAEAELQERELLPAVESTEALFEGALRAGELTIFEWLTARGRSVEARRAAADAVLRYARAAVELDEATGAAPGLAAAPVASTASHHPAAPDTHGATEPTRGEGP